MHRCRLCVNSGSFGGARQCRQSPRGSYRHFRRGSPPSGHLRCRSTLSHWGFRSGAQCRAAVSPSAADPVMRVCGLLGRMSLDFAVIPASFRSALPDVDDRSVPGATPDFSLAPLSGCGPAASPTLATPGLLTRQRYLCTTDVTDGSSAGAGNARSARRESLHRPSRPSRSSSTATGAWCAAWGTPPSIPERSVPSSL